MIINNFHLNKKIDAKKNSQLLINFTKQFLSSKYMNINLKLISELINIPKNILQNECKHYLQYNFDNKLGKYNSNFFYINAVKDFFKFIFFFSWIIFFSNKNKNAKKIYQLIIDDLDHEHSITTFKELEKYFPQTLFITTLKKFDKKNNYFFFNNYKNLNVKINLKFCYSYFLYLPFKFLYLSFKSKNNLFGINLHILKIYFKYSSVFENNKAKFLIQERYYRSSSLKNYLFKDSGGENTFLTQRVLGIYSSFGMFVNCDYFLSLGKRTADIILNQDSQIKKIIPIGSLSLHQSYFNSKINLDELASYDLLDLESRMGNFNDVYDSFWNDWYFKFSWLSKLSIRNPKLKIAIKIRPEHISVMENKDIKNAIDNSNIKIIDGSEYNFKFNTYHYAFKAKSLCTWISTLGFEMIGHGKKCFYINPEMKNSSFKELEILKKFTIDNFVDFEKKILEEISNVENNKKNYFEDDFCVKSENIYQNLAKIIKDKDHSV